MGNVNTLQAGMSHWLLSDNQLSHKSLCDTEPSHNLPQDGSTLLLRPAGTRFMTNAALQRELDMLADLIGTEPAGMGIDSLSRKLGDSCHRRSLQRRLALLVEQKRIERIGQGGPPVTADSCHPMPKTA